MAEVTSAVIATSLVLISVFIPVSFFPGTTGILYKQFSLTIAFSIAISAFNALTLSPALGGDPAPRRGTEKTGIMGLLLNPIERLIQWIIRVYARMVTFVVRIRYVMLVHLPRRPGGDGYHVHARPHGLHPAGGSVLLPHHRANASRELLSATPQTSPIRSPPSFARTTASSAPSRSWASHSPAAARQTPASSLLRSNPSTTAPRWGRTLHCAQPSLLDVGPKLFGVPGGIAFAAEPPAVAGIGTVGGFQFILQDSGRNTFGDIDRVAHTIVGQGRAPGIRPHRHEHYLHLERSATSRHHRSREGQGHGGPLQSGHCGPQHLHGLQLRQRL